MLPFTRNCNDGIIIEVHVQPNAKKSEIKGMHGDRLKVRLNAPPVDGKANEELIRLLSKILSVPKNKIEIIKGHTSRDKTVRIIGTDPDFLFCIFNEFV